MSGGVVVKVGGHALATSESLDAVIAMVARDLRSVVDAGSPVVIVHGGGPQIERDLARAALSPQVVDGLRVTTDESIEVVARALAELNTQVVATLCRHGLRARSSLGRTGVLCARALGGVWGRVGTDITVDSASLLAEGAGTPVVDPIATDMDGRLLNCNADAVAGAISSAISADALVLLSDVPQVRATVDDPATALRSLSRADVSAMRARGDVVDGMIPKLAAAVSAVDAGARRVVIADGRAENALANALEGVGQFTEVHA